VSGSYYAVLTANGCTFTDDFVSVGNVRGISGPVGCVIRGSWTLDTTAFEAPANCVFVGATVNGTGAIPFKSITANNTLFGCTVTGTISYATAVPVVPLQMVSWDHGASVGATAFYSPTCTGSDDATTPSPDANTPLKLTFTSAANPAVLDMPVFGWANKTLAVSVAAKQSGTGWTTPCVLQLLNADVDPDAAGAVLASATIAENTDWQTLTLSYTPTVGRPLIVRVQAANATGNLWVDIRGIQIANGTVEQIVTTNAANAATLEAVKASLKNSTTVTFGASSVTGTLPVNMRPHYRRKAKR